MRHPQFCLFCAGECTHFLDTLAEAYLKLRPPPLQFACTWLSLSLVPVTLDQRAEEKKALWKSLSSSHPQSDIKHSLFLEER